MLCDFNLHDQLWALVSVDGRACVVIAVSPCELL